MSEILDIAHEMAQDLFRVGAMDEITMREMEALCASIGTAVECDTCDLSAGTSERKV